MQGVSLQVCGESPPTKSKWSAVEPTAVGRHGRISRLDTEPRQRLGPLCVGQGTRTAVHTPTRAPSTTDRRIFDSEEAASSRHRTKDFTPSRASARDGRTTFDAALGMFRLCMGESESSRGGPTCAEERGNPTDSPNRHPQAGALRPVNIDPRSGPSLA